MRYCRILNYNFKTELEATTHNKIELWVEQAGKAIHENSARCELKLVLKSNSYVASIAHGMGVRGQTTETFVPLALD